jgi:hypothetical protein
VGKQLSISNLDPLRTLATDAKLATVRWPWLIFGVFLACGSTAFTLSTDWSAQTWLDVAAYAVSLIGIVGVFLYAFDRVLSGAAPFWRAFRWLFILVVTLQSIAHAIRVANEDGYSAAGTIGLVFAVALIVGWIFVLQWIAMGRLATEPRS